MEIVFDKKQQQHRFTIQYQNESLLVIRQTVQNQVVYIVQFPGKVPPLFLTRATNYLQQRFWTSVPQGRQKEADRLGPLIEAFILSTN